VDYHAGVSHFGIQRSHNPMQQSAPAAEARSLDRKIIPFPRTPRMPQASQIAGGPDDRRSGLFHIVLLPLAIAAPSLVLLALLMGAFLIILALVGLLAAAIIICELVHKFRRHRARLAAFDSGSIGYPGRAH
jgi:hypothetical protein